MLSVTKMLTINNFIEKKDPKRVLLEIKIEFY